MQGLNANNNYGVAISYAPTAEPPVTIPNASSLPQALKRPLQTVTSSTMSPQSRQPVRAMDTDPSSAKDLIHSSASSSSTHNRTVQELFNVQTKFLKSELYTIGINMQKKLLEQDAEISALKKVVLELKKHQGMGDTSKPNSTSSSLATAITKDTTNDDILQNFASLIAMYAHPVQIASGATQPAISSTQSGTDPMKISHAVIPHDVLSTAPTIDDGAI
jgi:hypothetical protein